MDSDQIFVKMVLAMSDLKLNKNRPMEMASLFENSKVQNWKNLSIELYQLCVTVIFALSHLDFF